MVKIDSISLDELSKLWIALGAPLRLSVSLTVSSAEPCSDSAGAVTSATVAPQTAALDTKNVTQLYQAVFKPSLSNPMVGRTATCSSNNGCFKTSRKSPI